MLYPHPSLSPLEVVRIQAFALGENDTPRPDCGIEVVWRFASTENKAHTGPLDRFKQMVHNPLYSPMLNHTGAEFGSPLVKGKQAQIDVVLQTRRLGPVTYRFILRRVATGDTAHCWVTDAVGPLG